MMKWFMSLAMMLIITFACAPDAPATPSGLTAGSNGLTWVNPTDNSDNSPISDLAGTYIYCHPPGTVPTNLKREKVTGAGTTAILFASIPWLTDADLECEATAFDTSDNESGYSNSATRILPVTASDIPNNPSNLTPSP